MNAIRAVAAFLALTPMPTFGHRLDEYLQGALVSVAKDRVQVELTLTPGILAFPFVIQTIDVDGDGVISAAEQRTYAEQVRKDLTLAIDGQRVTPRLTQSHFAPVEEMKAGRGEIQLNFTVVAPSGRRGRKLVLENHHQKRISVYQANCLQSNDPRILIGSQKRNYTQSLYELEYEETDVAAESRLIATATSGLALLAPLAILLLTRVGIELYQRRTASVVAPKAP